MGVAHLLTVHRNGGIGHHAFKHQFHFLAAPRRRNGKRAAIGAGLVAHLTVFFLVVAAIGVFAEALLFPARRYLNLAPPSALHALGALEIPLNGIVGVVSRQVYRLSLLGCCRDSDGKHRQ